MPKKAHIFRIFLTFFFVFAFLYQTSPALSATADHVVISEIQIDVITATDEFVELYNPTSSPINMEGWRLTRKTSTGTQSNLVLSISGTIPAHGYFLIAHPNYDGTTTSDLPYSAISNSITGNNSVILYSDAGTTEVDMVHMDDAIIPEGTPIETPEPSTSIERKASNSSTVVSMAIGGSDELLGNGEDTNNSHDDFLARDVPQPQNSSSPTEIPSEEPTTTPTPTPVPTGDPTPTPIPTETPTPTPTVTNSIVISEVQIAGATTTDEFIELYNPTSSSVDMEGWRLTRKTSSGNQSNLVLSISGVIPAHGYFLIAHPNYDGTTTYDLPYSATSNAVSANNSVVLYSDASITVVDKVGMGDAIDVETTATENPATDTSLERKAQSTSTLTSMAPGGVDEFAGNGEDTNNNFNDFLTKDVPQPQNSSSPTESLGEEPTVTPTPSPEPTESPTPTPEPTVTPTPEPTETPVPTPTIEPTPTPSPSPVGKIIGRFMFPGKTTICTLNYKMVQIGFFQAIFPRVICTRN
ncbi:lamin tail domain-containing protein [Patescibacteria group bacterium]|nr:lamin tail domain-containing protein [Patescibacteria group bacterium]